MGLSTWLLALLLLAGPADASLVRTTEHFRFHADARAHEAALRLADDAEARFTKVCRDISACDALPGPVDVFVTEDAESFAKAFPDDSPMAEWAVGVAFPAQRRIVLRAHGTAFFTLTETFDHEVSHVLVHAVARGGSLPRWFLEGVAIWQAGENVVERLASAQKAALTGQLMPLSSLSRGFPIQGAGVELAYAQSALFVRWLEREHGSAAMHDLFARLSRGDAFEDAFEGAFRGDVLGLETLWRRDLEERSNLLIVMRDGTILWVTMALLFLWAAAVKLREKKLALADEVGEEDDEVISAAWLALQRERDEGEGPTVH